MKPKLILINVLLLQVLLNTCYVVKYEKINLIPKDTLFFYGN